jgi:hypothetical protein
LIKKRLDSWWLVVQVLIWKDQIHQENKDGWQTRLGHPFFRSQKNSQNLKDWMLVLKRTKKIGKEFTILQSHRARKQIGLPHTMKWHCWDKLCS